MSIPLKFWWPQYIRSFFVLANTYDPTKTYADGIEKYNKDAMRCYIISVIRMLPDTDLKNQLKDFVSMTSNVVKSLFQSDSIALNSFLQSPQGLELSSIMVSDGQEFLYTISQNKDQMFLWVYLLQAYLFIVSFNREFSSFKLLVFGSIF